MVDVSEKTETRRVATFDGCRWMIDELKQRVPIWNMEITPEGAQGLRLTHDANVS